MDQNRKILVTGGGGYIGVVTVEELLKNGYQVKVLDTFYWGTRPLNHLRDKIELIKQDIRDVKPQILANVSHVIHLAGLSNDPMAEYNPTANFQINTQATKRFAQMCKEKGVDKFIYASSASIYYQETANDSLQDEKSPVNPKAAYSLSKHLPETELLKMVNASFCPVIFRQGTVFGFSPKMRYDLVVNTMVKDALATGKITVLCRGKQWRPLVDVRDVARAYILALCAPEEKIRGQIFNLAYKNYKILPLAKVVKKALENATNSNIKIEVDLSDRKDRSYRISTSKIKKVLGWRPPTSIEDSVRDMVKNIEKWNFKDFSNPRYFNIEWMKLLTSLSP